MGNGLGGLDAWPAYPPAKKGLRHSDWGGLGGFSG